MTNTTVQCLVLGCGAWGPGFHNWRELSELLLNPDMDELTFTKPEPKIIPANERRRAPLLVKMAVETSCQAVVAADLPPQQLACVFASGLGDTDITDYLCRALTTELKQLSPTKFHNSVHNAPAGYWTISTGCMEASNSISAYRHTVGMAMFEAVSQCVEHQQPVLITVYDAQVCAVFEELFHCKQNLALSLVIAPVTPARTSAPLLTLSTCSTHRPDTSSNLESNSRLGNNALANMLAYNPTAELAAVMESLARLEKDKQQRITPHYLTISPHTSIMLTMENRK